MIPVALQKSISAALQSIGDSTPIRDASAVGGGCINNAQRVTTAQGTYFLKWNAQPLVDMFLVEAQGLSLLRATRMIRVPMVIAAVNATTDCPAYLLMEWLEQGQPASRSNYQALLGRQLAEMHRESVFTAYGLDHDNYIGSSPQYNGWNDDWVQFFRERRLLPQIELAQRQGLLPTARRRMLDRVIERLDIWLGAVERCPVLLHGDLWGGNVLVGPDGVPALIDPAVAYGDREAEIAFTELFGGFSSHFYQAYAEVWPLAPDYPERRDLYNLYHLLNHLNLFGEGYGVQVDSIARRYGG